MNRFRTKVVLIVSAVLLLPGLASAEIFLPGMQPEEAGIEFAKVQQCKMCHSRTKNGDADPFLSWQSGMMANAAINKLKELKDKGKPFFLGMGFFKPHLPFIAPKRYFDLYDRDAIEPVRYMSYVRFRRTQGTINICLKNGTINEQNKNHKINSYLNDTLPTWIWDRK